MRTSLDTIDIGKAERGEQALTIAMLKKIAKATGVTQAYLVNALKGSGKPTTSPSTTTVVNTNSCKRVTSTKELLIT